MASTFAVLLGLLLVVALVSAVLAWRNRLPFRIGMRNVRRARWRTVLIVLGLLIGTTIISGSLTINDTVGAVEVHFVYQAWGFTDEAVYNSSVAAATGTYSYFPTGVATNLSTAAAANPLIAGVTPEIVAGGSVYDRATGVPETGINIVGVNASAAAALGDFTFDNGSTTAGPAAGGVLLDDQLAQNVGASTGDAVVLYGVSAVPLVVQGIVKDDTRGGFLGGNTAFVTIAAAQKVANESGRVNFVAVTNVGSLEGGVAHSDAVTAFLNATLVAAGSPHGLAAFPVLQSAINAAIASSQSIATLFLVLGLFSIVAGALLIVGIFVTLAEERKGEMGMLRAVGLPRRSLVYVYYFEGTVYAAVSALAGTALGVAVGFVLLTLYTRSGSVSSQVAAAFQSSFTVSATSLVIAYVLGFLLTLATIAAASARVSRLNIVRAIRSIPEPPPSVRTYTYLAYLGAVLLVLGGLLFLRTRTGTGDISLPFIGLGLAIVGAALVATRFVKNRYAFTVAGALLVVWGGTVPLHRALLGSGHSGTIFAVFVEGIELVTGAVLLFVYNADLIVAGVSRLAGRKGRRVSVARVGFGYPRRQPARSAVNFTIFALVIFTVVLIAAYGASVSAALANSVTAESGGYTYFGVTNGPVDGLPGQIQNNSTLGPLVPIVVPLVFGVVTVVLPGSGGTLTDGIYAGPTNVSASESLYTTNQYNFTATLGGLSAAQVWHEIATEPNVTVADQGYEPGQSSFVGAAHGTVPLGGNVTLVNPATHATDRLKVIGFLSQQFLSGFWVNPSAAAGLGYSGYSAFLFRIAPSASATPVSQDLKRAFFGDGLVLYNFAQILQSAIQSTQAVIGLLEVFVALGLAVGIAGMGIVALRAVTERRTQIGMLRATGFTRSMVLGAFLVEYSFISLFGIAVGTGLAVWLYYGAVSANSLGEFGVFVVPAVTIVTITLVAYVLTILAILGPSWKAANLAPAEAVRFTE